MDLRLFRINKTVSEGNRIPRGDFRLIKRDLILKNQIQDESQINFDYKSTLIKCKQDLATLKEQVIDFSRNLEIL